MNARLTALSLALTAAATAAMPRAQGALHSPTDRAGFEGSSSTHYPLGRATMRLQTLHADLPGGAVLQGLAYRRDAINVRGVVDAFQSDLEVRVSMSPRTPTTASTTFAANEGTAPLLVLPRTVVQFPAVDRPLLDPAPSAAYAIPWAVPFTVPQGGGTVCIDVIVWGNATTGGNNRNFSVWLDAHELRTDGFNEAPGFRIGTGCAAPGASATCTSTASLWLGPSGSRVDAMLRNGLPDDGTGSVLVALALGLANPLVPLPGAAGCTLLTSGEWWQLLPGTTGSAGEHAGSVALPALPPGYRLWLQQACLAPATGALVLSDGNTLRTPPAALPVPTVVRIAHASDPTSATGTVSFAVPVVRFL